MANIYMQFSEELPLETEEEHEWIRNALKGIDPDLLEEGREEELEAWCDARQIDKDSAEYFPMFGWGITIGRLWVYSEESADLDHVVGVVQSFLRKFRPKSCCCLQYAETCSRPRIGEFGGGAVFVTADNVNWLNTGAWVTDRTAGFEEGNR